MNKPRIRLTLVRADGHDSDAEIAGDAVTPVMIAAAEQLLETLSTGEPPPLPKGFYEVVAKSFGIERDEAKRRIMARLYGARAERTPARCMNFKGCNWQGFLDETEPDGSCPGCRGPTQARPPAPEVRS